MDLLKMQYFRDVFELQSFTKAANKNFVYQSAITQQIASIEKELGVSLFKREHGKISNTPAGELFYVECQAILDHYTQALEDIRKCSACDVHTMKKLRIGISGVMEEQFFSCMSKYIQKYPHVRIDFVEGSYSFLINELMHQEIDLIFGTACELENIPGTTWKILFTAQQQVLMSKENILADRKTLNMNDLEGQTLVVPSDDMIPSCHKKGLQLPQRTKYKIDIEFVDSFDAIKLKVGGNQGITFVAESFESYDHTNFKKLVVQDIRFVCTMGIAYLKNENNQLIENFIKILPEYRKE